MLGYLMCLVVSTAVAYAGSERYFYFWDYAAYQDITAYVSDGFRLSFAEGLNRVRASLSNDYNAIFAMPIVPVARMFGTQRPLFLGCLALFYQVPFILAVSAVTRQIFWGRPRRVFWIAALTTALVPTLWAPMLRGYPDPGGATLLLIAVWLYLVSLRRGGSLRMVAVAGVYLAAAMLFRRHYAYATVAFFLSVTLYRLSQIVLALGRRSGGAGVELRHAVAEIAVMGAATAATLVMFGSAFIQYLMAADYYTLYQSFLNSPRATFLYFARFFGGGLCVLAGIGWLVTWRAGAARRAPALFCALFGIVSVLLWVLVVRQTGTQLGLHLTLLVMPGLVGLVLAGSRLTRRSSRLAFLSCVTGFFVLNMVQSLSPWQPPPAWPVGSVFSDRYPALSRPDDKEVQRLVSYLRSLARPLDAVFVDGSSTTMNYDILVHAERAVQPFGPRLSIPTTPHIDSRDWLPFEELVKARVVVITSPPQFHLNPAEQDVVQLAHDVFATDWEFAADFFPTQERFHLEKNVEARVFVRQRDTDLPRALRLLRDMRRWMGSRPLGPMPPWVALTPYAYWVPGSRTTVRAVLAPGRDRQAILFNGDWRGDHLTVNVRLEGPLSPVVITASAVDLETGQERLMDSQSVIPTGTSPVVLRISPKDAGGGALMLSVQAVGGAPLVVMSNIVLN